MNETRRLPTKAAVGTQGLNLPLLRDKALLGLAGSGFYGVLPVVTRSVITQSAPAAKEATHPGVWGSRR